MSVDGIVVTSNVELGDTVRSFEPSDVVDIVVIRDGETLTIPVGLGANTTAPRTIRCSGRRCSACSSYSPPLYEQHGIVGSAVNSVTDVFPVTWESTKGIVKVLNPVNLVDQLTDTENADPTARPTTVYGIATVSDDVGESGGLAGVLYMLAILNIFVGVFNMMPLLPLDGGHAAIAVYERIQEKRRHMTGRYFADVERLDAVRDGRDRGAGDADVHRPVPRHHPTDPRITPSSWTSPARSYPASPLVRSPSAT